MPSFGSQELGTPTLIELARAKIRPGEVGHGAPMLATMVNPEKIAAVPVPA